MIDKKNIPFYLIVVGVFIVLKVGFIYAENNDLLFLLKPTNALIEFVTGSSAQYSESNGYYHQRRNIVIDKSCSGFNFWLVNYMMLIFLAIKNLENNKAKIIAIPLFLVISYLLTIFVNTSRINVSIFIQHSELSFIGDKVNWLHQAEGSFVYLFFLITIYLTFECLFKSPTRYRMG